MVFFLTHVEPLHPLRGKEAIFFIREQSEQGSKSHVIVKEVPHYFFTPTMSPEEAYYTRELLDHDRSLEHLIITQHQYSRNKHFLRAEGSKEDRLILPEPFLCKLSENGAKDPLGLNSPSKLLRWLYPPFLQVPSANPDELPSSEEMRSGTFRRKFISLEQALQEPAAALDIEVENWEIGKDHIFMAIYYSPRRKIIFHDLPFTDEERDGFQLWRYTSQQELGILLTSVLQQDNPLWLYGHNIMNYDQLQLRKLTRRYCPATNWHHPITKSAQGFGKVITKGRWTLDMYGAHFNYHNLHESNSLAVLSEEKKGLSYAAQARQVILARQGNRDAFQLLLEYMIGDGKASWELGEQYKTSIAEIARHFRVEPDAVCTLSKLSLAHDDFKRRHFLIKKTYADSWKTRRVEEKKLSLDKFKKKFLPSGFQQGFFEGVQAVYLTPFVAGTLEFHRQKSPELLQRIQQSTSPREKFMYLQVLNAKSSFLVQEILRIADGGHSIFTSPSKNLTGRQQAALYCLFTYHGLTKIDPSNFISGITEALEWTKKALRKYEIINAGSSFHFLHGHDSAERIDHSFYGCYFGRGEALSLEQGKVISNPLHEEDSRRFIYQGFNSRKGLRCNFEKRVLAETIGKIFSGKAFGEISDYLDTEIATFNFRQKPPEEYCFQIKTRTYARNLLEEVLEQATHFTQNPLSESMLPRYRALQSRIGERFSRQTAKELRQLLQECKDNFSFPFIEELWGEILHPFPGRKQLVYAADCPGLLPVSMVAVLDYDRYAAKVKETFRSFYEVLEPTQLKLAL